MILNEHRYIDEMSMYLCPFVFAIKTARVPFGVFKKLFSRDILDLS